MSTLIYAHRGASGLYPENTMAAFRGALRQKANGIELDVQLTRDGEIVVIHDHRLERTTDGTGFVGHYSYAQLNELSAGGWFDPQFAEARIPRLEEVLRFAKPTKLRVIIEIKNFLVAQPDIEVELCKLVESTDMVGRVVFSSFNFNSLYKLKELNSNLQTALLYFGHLPEPWKIATKYGASQLHVPYEEVTPAFLKEAHKRSFPVVSWAADSKKAIRRLLSLKIDGIITDYPGQARKMKLAKPR